ncbi:WbqC family protein [uncultured Planktosalinus sp.]|uniref:WbqC family protein n=1 Tax=uncultured Planktosalinus sp. TaxID=1810935 RepID=UPI0030DB3C8D|tara:strand:+ start:156 stop:794 length:639 start_codon:yes stop_codon:yes gene_type:complete
MHILIHPVYFGSIANFVAIAKAEKITFEKEDNYQKQTYRNRTFIATPEGPLLLNIPIKHTSKGKRGERQRSHQKYKNVCIENDFPWQRAHWKSIQIAYRTSPFFEFYEDDFAPLYQKPFRSLMEFNLECFKVVSEALGLEQEIYFTNEYHKKADAFQDYRYLVKAKNELTFVNSPYTQVLEKHHGFLPNLSILDLLFNEGTNALHYLESQSL